MQFLENLRNDPDGLLFVYQQDSAEVKAATGFERACQEATISGSLSAVLEYGFSGYSSGSGIDILTDALAGLAQHSKI